LPIPVLKSGPALKLQTEFGDSVSTCIRLLALLQGRIDDSHGEQILIQISCSIQPIREMNVEMKVTAELASFALHLLSSLPCEFHIN